MRRLFALATAIVSLAIASSTAVTSAEPATRGTVGEYVIADGDLNDTHSSSLIAILDDEAGPSSSLLTGPWYEQPESTRYTYIFNSESEALDHVYVTNLPPDSRPTKRLPAADARRSRPAVDRAGLGS